MMLWQRDPHKPGVDKMKKLESSLVICDAFLTGKGKRGEAVANHKQIHCTKAIGDGDCKQFTESFQFLPRRDRRNRCFNIVVAQEGP